MVTRQRSPSFFFKYQALISPPGPPPTIAKSNIFRSAASAAPLPGKHAGGAQQFEGRLAEEWLAAEDDADFARRVATLGADIEKSSAAGKAQEALNSLIAPDDNAMRLERRFGTLSVPGRLRLGFGTSQVVRAAGWDAKRLKLGLHVTDVLEALESIEPVGGVTTAQPACHHPKYGDLVRLTGLTSAGRAITLVAQVERLPLALVDIEADA